MNCSRSRDGERSLSGAFQMGGFPVVLWHRAGQNFALGFWGRGFLIFRAKRWERSLSVSALDLVACSHSPLNALSPNWRRWCWCAVTDEGADCTDDSTTETRARARRLYFPKHCTVCICSQDTSCHKGKFQVWAHVKEKDKTNSVCGGAHPKLTVCTQKCTRKE